MPDNQNIDIKSIGNLVEYLETHSKLDFKEWLPTSNLFEIIKVEHAEIRHSNILGWLMNPNNPHQLKDIFVKKILLKLIENDTVVINHPDNRQNREIVEFMSKCFNDGKVYRETENNIDVLFTDKRNKLNIIIENKTWTKDHDKQLKKYREYVEKRYHDFETILIYLTPFNASPMDADETERSLWNKMSYNDVYMMIDEMLIEQDMNQKTRYVLMEYNENLKRNLLEKKELQNLSVEIYLKHKDVLDMIFEHKNDYMNVVKRKIYKDFQRFTKEQTYFTNTSDHNTVENDDTFRLRFTTKNLNDYLNSEIESQDKKAWQSTTKYFYEIGESTSPGIFKIWLTIKNEDKNKIMKNPSANMKVLESMSKQKEYRDWEELWGKIIDFTSVELDIENLRNENIDDEILSFFNESLNAVKAFESELENNI